MGDIYLHAFWGNIENKSCSRQNTMGIIVVTMDTEILNYCHSSVTSYGNLLIGKYEDLCALFWCYGEQIIVTIVLCGVVMATMPGLP